MATLAQQQAFLQQYGAAASSAASNLGLSQSEVLGQWALETGWGTSFAGANNLGNVSPGGQVANYPSVNAGVSAYENTLYNLGVAGPTYANSPASFAAALQRVGYATDPNYANKVDAAVMQVQALQTGTTAPSTASTTGAVQATQAHQTTPTAANTGFLSWLQAHAGSWGIVIMGAVLVAGALMISSKETVLNVPKGA